MTCPTLDGEDLQNATVEYGAPDRAVKEVHPPGMDGTLLMHMGKTTRRLTAKGILTPAGGDVVAKMKKFEGLSDTGVHTLVVPYGTVGTRSFEKVRLVSMRWGDVKGDASTGGVTVEYEMEFQQLLFKEGE